MNKTEEKIYELLKSNVLFRDEKGIYTIFPQKLLIKASGKSERTVQYALKKLEEQKYIVREVYKEINLVKFYFSQEEEMKNSHIIDRRKVAPPPPKITPPPPKITPPPPKITPSPPKIAPLSPKIAPLSPKIAPPPRKRRIRGD